MDTQKKLSVFTPCASLSHKARSLRPAPEPAIRSKRFIIVGVAVVTLGSQVEAEIDAGHWGSYFMVARNDQVELYHLHAVHLHGEQFAVESRPRRLLNLNMVKYRRPVGSPRELALEETVGLLCYLHRMNIIFLQLPRRRMFPFSNFFIFLLPFFADAG